MEQDTERLEIPDFGQAQKNAARLKYSQHQIKMLLP